MIIKIIYQFFLNKILSFNFNSIKNKKIYKFMKFYFYKYMKSL